MQAAGYSAQDAFIWCCRLWTYTWLSHCWLSRHSGPWEHIESLSNTILTSSNALLATAAKSLQSCPTLCDPKDCSLPGFSVHGILQARTLEWVAIAFSEQCLMHEVAKVLEFQL